MYCPRWATSNSPTLTITVLPTLFINYTVSPSELYSGRHVALPNVNSYKADAVFWEVTPRRRVRGSRRVTCCWHRQTIKNREPLKMKVPLKRRQPLTQRRCVTPRKTGVLDYTSVKTSENWQSKRCCGPSVAFHTWALLRQLLLSN
jgi:hypothetical protein